MTSSSVVTLFLMGGNRPENPLGVTSTFGPSPHSAHSDTHFMVSTVTPISSASSLKYPRAFFPPFCVQVGPVQTTTLEPSSRAVGASNSWVVVARESAVCVGPKASVKTPIADSRRRAVLVLDMMAFLLLWGMVLVFGIACCRMTGKVGGKEVLGCEKHAIAGMIAYVTFFLDDGFGYEEFDHIDYKFENRLPTRWARTRDRLF